MTAGGNALKYYASVRLDVRRSETLKADGVPIGSHTRVKVVKNKVAPPFKEAEFDVLYGKGISRDSELIDLGVKLEVIQKSGAFFYYNEQRIAQGREKARDYLREHPELAAEIEAKIREKLSAGNVPAAEAEEEKPEPVEIPIEAAATVTASGAKAKIDISVDD